MGKRRESDNWAEEIAQEQDELEKLKARKEAVEQLREKPHIVVGSKNMSDEIVLSLSSDDYFEVPIFNTSYDTKDKLAHWLLCWPSSGHPGIKGDDFGLPGQDLRKELSALLKNNRRELIPGQRPENAKPIEDYIYSLLGQRAIQAMSLNKEQVFSGIELRESTWEKYSTTLILPRRLPEIIPGIAKSLTKLSKLNTREKPNEYYEYAANPRNSKNVAKTLGLSALYYVAITRGLISSEDKP